MNELRRWLENKQPDLTGALMDAIAMRSDAHPVTRSQASALALALSVAVEQGPAVLDSLLRQWAEELPAADSPNGRWATTLAVVRESIWTHFISEFSPAKALTHLRVVESLMVHAVTLAANLDQQGQIKELELRAQQVQERLQWLDKSKSDFISIAAHELKTPLTLIDGYVNMLMQQLPEEARARAGILLGGISNGTHRLAKIIENMIDVSMIDTQVFKISFQPVFLRQTIKMATRDLSDALRFRQVELKVDELPEDGAPTAGDPERLYQALFNVISNAVKYTPDGGRIHIKNHLQPSDSQDENLRGYLHLQVVDSGIGIAPENLERIFDKFSGLGDVDLHSTSKYKFKGGGAGLGLAITKGIIKAHGGRIWAHSEGCDEETCPGATFHVLLPLLNAAPEQLLG